LQLRKNGIKPIQTQTAPFFYVDNQCYWNIATVWNKGIIGKHGGESEYFLGMVRQKVDAFSNEFLKANGK